MSAQELLADDLWDLEPLDGIHELRPRRSTRLWFRALPPEIQPLPRRPVRLTHRNTPLALPAVAGSKAAELAEIARLALEASRQIETVPAAPIAPVDIESWLVVPDECPALMLAASPTLGGDMAEAHLAPGVQFRVLATDNGVAHVEVLTNGGRVVEGYCNTVDLACYNSAGASRITTSMLRPKTGILRLTQGFGATR